MLFENEVSIMIASVKVQFEERENMPGVLIIQSVISYDEDENELKDYQDMVGQEFFGDDAYTDAINYIAKKLGVPSDLIEPDSEYVETPWDD